MPLTMPLTMPPSYAALPWSRSVILSMIQRPTSDSTHAAMVLRWTGLSTAIHGGFDDTDEQFVCSDLIETALTHEVEPLWN